MISSQLQIWGSYSSQLNNLGQVTYHVMRHKKSHGPCKYNESIYGGGGFAGHLMIIIELVLLYLFSILCMSEIITFVK